MTLVLGIDTSTQIGSVAVVRDRTLLAQATSERGSGLLVVIDAVCTGAGITAGELDAIAIGAGPGSFTGLRIGMATAKGIAFATGKPLWAVSSLAALAEPALTGDNVVCAVLDARRGEVYAAAFRRGAIVAEERVISFPDGLGALAAELQAAHPRVLFAGDHELLEVFGDRFSAQIPTGATVAELALAGARIDVVVDGAPSYVRRPEAELRYPDGVPGALRRR